MPRSLRDFDAWVVRTALCSASSLFREGRVLIEEEPQLTELGLYHAVLAAIAAGEHKPSSIASRVGRPLGALPHALGALKDVGLIEREVDALRSNRTTYAITEPIVAFHHALMRPAWASLVRGRAEAAWAEAKPTFLAKRVGPTYERLCREWAREKHPAARVARRTVADPAGKTAHEIDVVVRDGKKLLALGEAKWRQPVDPSRLEHVRALLGSRGYDVSRCQLLAFTGESRKAGKDAIDLERLYA